jgi:hypothetical protein
MEEVSAARHLFGVGLPSFLVVQVQLLYAAAAAALF